MRLPTLPWQIAYCADYFPEVLHELDACQAAVVRMRYGLDEEPKNLEEFGALLGLTRERVREVESEALAKLKTLNKTMPLWD